MSDAVELSVVLPNYNHGHLIRRALGALLEQERPPDEIIIVDDNSTDDSHQVLREFADRVPSVKILFSAERRGAIRAINRGLEITSGRYVYFAASDDFVVPGFFRLALDMLARYPQTGLFCGEAVLLDGLNNRRIGMRPAVRPLVHAGFVDAAATRALLGRIDNWILTGCAVFRRDAVLGVGGFDEDLGSTADGYLARKVALMQGFSFAPTTVATWCVYADSLSRTTALRVDSALQVLRIVPEKIAADPVFPDGYAQIFARRWRFAVSRLALEADPADVELARVLGARSSIDRFVIGVMSPVVSSKTARIVILAWLWLRLRPTSLIGLARTAFARRMERMMSRSRAPGRSASRAKAEPPRLRA